MNKKIFNIYFMIFLMSFMATLMSWPLAEVHSLEYPPLSSQALMMGNVLKTSTGDILLDNFEYWDSPMNHGWLLEEPSYPIYGAGIGYGMVQGILDFEEGSRVLDVYRPASVFLPFNSPYMPYTITKGAAYIDGSSQEYVGSINPELSFKIRAPLAIEAFDTFSFEVIGTTDKEYKSGSNKGDDHIFQLILIPRENSWGDLKVGIDTIKKDSVDLDEESAIIAYLGRQFQDGTWHTVNINIKEAVEKAIKPDEKLKRIMAIKVHGNQYRLDDIIFFKESPYKNRAPYLFRIGPVYSQLFDTTGQYSTRLIFAEDPDMGEWCLDAGGNSMCIAKGLDVGLPDTHHLAYENVLYYTDSEGNKKFLDGEKSDPLVFKVTVGGPGEQGTMAPNLWTRIPVDPTQTPPLAYIPKRNVPITQWLSGDNLEKMRDALFNSGFKFWPNVIVMYMQGQVMEDLIVTCEVSDGRISDMETFPVSVVNYPVTNNPPRIEQLNDQCFEVGLVPDKDDVIMGGYDSTETITNVYTITATDPDPGDSLTFSATINGLSSYQYGPWVERIIDPYTGILSFTPQFEGVFQCIVTVRDSRGMATFGSFNLFCVNKGTWFNHSPIVLKIIESPQRCKAGELFTLSQLNMFDPDDGKLFYSCNIGSVSDGGVYTIQTQFPGQYSVQITGYDRLGGYATQQFLLEVSPWWSM